MDPDIYISTRDWRRKPPLRLSLRSKLHIHWCWIKCTNQTCRQMAAVAIVPYIIRWGPDGWQEKLRQTARCSKCGKRGIALQHPIWAGSDTGWAPIPVGQLAPVAPKNRVRRSPPRQTELPLSVDQESSACIELTRNGSNFVAVPRRQRGAAQKTCEGAGNDVGRRQASSRDGALSSILASVSRQLDDVERCVSDLRAIAGGQTAVPGMAAALATIQEAAAEFTKSASSAEIALTSIGSPAASRAARAVSAFLAEFESAVCSIVSERGRRDMYSAGLTDSPPPGSSTIQVWSPVENHK